MPPVIGTQGQIILDGFPYWLLGNTYMNWQPRLRKATPRADGAESYVDLGPGKRIWKMTILCQSDLRNYDGTPTNFTGQQYHDTLTASYAKINTTLTYLDVDGNAHTIRFDHLAFHIPNVPTQTSPEGLAFHADIELVEV